MSYLKLTKEELEYLKMLPREISEARPVSEQEYLRRFRSLAKNQKFLKLLQPFTWPGVVGPQGETIPDDTPEHHLVVSDVITVSDELLRKLYANPHLLHEQLSPRGFEELVAELLGRLGYEVTLTPASRDAPPKPYQELSYRGKRFL
jgi:hypothetical protein